uniref:Uncharacterized protein n=1 Tax=Arundo donax TaxID=35708 RepID=A0A0A9HJ21_ARUDO
MVVWRRGSAARGGGATAM